MPVQCLNSGTLKRVPQYHRMIATTTNEHSAIRRKCDGVDYVFVSLQGEVLRPNTRVPDRNYIILATTCRERNKIEGRRFPSIRIHRLGYRVEFSFT